MQVVLDGTFDGGAGAALPVIRGGAWPNPEEALRVSGTLSLLWSHAPRQRRGVPPRSRAGRAVTP